VTLELPEKLNKAPDFAPCLHFSQYFKASPGLVMSLLPVRRWALVFQLRSIILHSGFSLEKCEEIWVRDWYRYQGRERRDSLVNEKDC